MEHQGDHNWTMKNPEVLADMLATEETMMIFSNSMDHNESILKSEKSGDLRINPEKWSAWSINLFCF